MENLLWLRRNEGFNGWFLDGTNRDVKEIRYIGGFDDIEPTHPFPNITTVLTLTLSRVKFQYMPDFAALGSTVRHLMLAKFQVDMDDLFPFLYCFTQLEYLRIDDLIEVQDPDSDFRLTLQRKRLSLREVHLLQIHRNDQSDHWSGRHRLSDFLADSGETLNKIIVHGKSSCEMYDLSVLNGDAISGSWGPFSLRGTDNLMDVTLDSFSVIDVTETLNTLQFSGDSERTPAILHVAFPSDFNLPGKQDRDWEGFEQGLIEVHRRGHCLPLKFWLGTTEECEQWVKDQTSSLPGVTWLEAVQGWTKSQLLSFANRENVTIDLV